MLYLAVALWTLRVVLPAPMSTAPFPVEIPPVWRNVTAADLKLAIAIISAQSRTWLSAPWNLLDGPQCHPLDRALLLGERELFEGLLGVVPHLAVGEPVFTYNVVAILSIVLAGYAMQELVRAWTGSMIAAVVAGILFAVQPSRIGDLIHLVAVNNFWTPLTLLLLTRVFRRPTWPVAFGLGLAAAGQTVESIYPLLPHAFIVGTMAVWLVWRHRRELWMLAPKLGVATVVALTASAWSLVPYLRFRQTWGSLAGRAQMLYAIGDFAPGHAAYAGSVALVLAGLAMAYRVRRHECEGFRPHWPLLAAGCLCAWSSMMAIPLPGGWALPSLFGLLSDIVPGLDAVRRGAVVVSGWHLTIAVLAGFGVAGLIQGRRLVTRLTIGATCVALALLEVFVAPIAKASFGQTLRLEAHQVRPADPVLELYRKLGPGVVLDVPLDFGQGRFYRMADYLLASAYHEHRIAACYNSFLSPVQHDVARYAGRVMTDARAAAALAALDINDVVLHTAHFRSAMSLTTTPPSHLVEVARSLDRVLYRITEGGPVTEVRGDLHIGLRIGSTNEVVLTFGNRGLATYRHPHPIVPTAWLVRWLTPAGDVIQEDRRKLLLPTVLAREDEITRALDVTLPAHPRPLRVTIATTDAPDTILASADLP